jgi:beta-galactosidase
MTSWKVNGEELVRRGALPDFWRAPTDNDRGADLLDFGRGKPQDYRILYPSNIWERGASSWTPAEPLVEEQADGRVKVLFSGTILNGKAEVALTYFIDSGGRVQVDYAYSTDHAMPMIPRVGTEWILGKEMDSIRWYGRGPDPTYSDRRWEPMGIYHGAVMSNWVDYSRPQENGNKVDARWMEIINRRGVGLRIMGAQPLSVNALPFSKDEIRGKAYSWQLPEPGATFVNVDLAQMGVGGDNSWGLIAHPEYRLVSNVYRYTYFIEPIIPADTTTDNEQVSHPVRVSGR